MNIGQTIEQLLCFGEERPSDADDQSVFWSKTPKPIKILQELDERESVCWAERKFNSPITFRKNSVPSSTSSGHQRFDSSSFSRDKSVLGGDRHRAEGEIGSKSAEDAPPRNIFQRNDKDSTFKKSVIENTSNHPANESCPWNIESLDLASSRNDGFFDSKGNFIRDNVNTPANNSKFDKKKYSQVNETENSLKSIFKQATTQTQTTKPCGQSEVSKPSVFSNNTRNTSQNNRSGFHPQARPMNPNKFDPRHPTNNPIVPDSTRPFTQPVKPKPKQDDVLWYCMKDGVIDGPLSTRELQETVQQSLSSSEQKQDQEPEIKIKRINDKYFVDYHILKTAKNIFSIDTTDVQKMNELFTEEAKKRDQALKAEKVKEPVNTSRSKNSKMAFFDNLDIDDSIPSTENIHKSAALTVAERLAKCNKTEKVIKKFQLTPSVSDLYDLLKNKKKQEGIILLKQEHKLLRSDSIDLIETFLEEIGIQVLSDVDKDVFFIKGQKKHPNHTQNTKQIQNDRSNLNVKHSPNQKPKK